MPTPTYANNLLTRAIESDGVLDLIPGAGFNARIKGGAIGSLWADTRSTGALVSDYSQFRLTRAGIPKWRTGNNLDGTGNDDFFIHRDADGVVIDLDVVKITRSSGRVDFSGAVYSAGVLLTGGVGVPSSGGTFTGNVGFGGVTPTYPLHVAKSVAGDYVAFFRNTSVTGNGVLFQNGLDANPVIGVLNAAGTAAIRFFGDGRAEHGVLSTATSTVNPISVSTWVANSGVMMSLAGQKNADVQFFANQNGADATKGGGTRYGFIGLGADNGLHLSTNLRYFPSGTSPVLFDPTLPRANSGFDSEGTVSWTWDPAAIAGSGYDYRLGATAGGVTAATPQIDRSNSPYVPLSSQSFIIKLQGHDTSGVWPNAEGYNRVWLACMRKDQNMVLAVSPGADASPVPVLQIDQNQHSVFYGRVAWDASATSQAPIRLPSTAAPATGNGDIWYDGTNFRGHKGGVQMTFTLT